MPTCLTRCVCLALKLSKGESISKYVTRARNLSSDLALAGHPVTSGQLALRVLHGLPDTYEVVCSVALITYQDVSLLSIDLIIDRLKEREASLKAGKSAGAAAADHALFGAGHVKDGFGKQGRGGKGKGKPQNKPWQKDGKQQGAGSSQKQGVATASTATTATSPTTPLRSATSAGVTRRQLRGVRSTCSASPPALLRWPLCPWRG